MQSTILDVAIGLMLAYLLLALLCSGIQEWIAQLLNRRAAHLEAGIRNLIGDVPIMAGSSPPGASLSEMTSRHGVALDANAAASSWPARKMASTWRALNNFLAMELGRRKPRKPREPESLADLVLDHAAIVSMGKDGKAPTYVPAQAFAVAVTDSIKKICNQRGASLSQAMVATVVSRKPLNDALYAARTGTVADLQKARQSLESWFEEGMDRVSGWYKRETRVFMVAIGAVLAVAFNVDSIDLSKRLYADPALRAATANNAALYVANDAHNPARKPVDANKALKEQRSELDVFKLPVGWQGATGGRWEVVSTIIGWTLTALAVSLGAPFWFDLLAKLAPLRSSGKVPDKPAPAPPAPIADATQKVAAYSAGPPPPAQLAFTESDLSPYDMKDIQAKLGMQAPTGVIDDATRALVAAYQAKKSYDPTRIITADLASELLHS